MQVGRSDSVQERLTEVFGSLTSGIRAFLFRFERMLMLSFGRGQGWFDNVDGREHRRALLDCTAEGGCPYVFLNMSSSLPEFRAPTGVERVFNRGFGFLVGLGLGFSHNFFCRCEGERAGSFIPLRSICWNSGASGFWWLRAGGRNGFATLEPLGR